jgi:hypothetical protein
MLMMKHYCMLTLKQKRVHVYVKAIVNAWTRKKLKELRSSAGPVGRPSSTIEEAAVEKNETCHSTIFQQFFNLSQLGIAKEQCSKCFVISRGM